MTVFIVREKAENGLHHSQRRYLEEQRTYSYEYAHQTNLLGGYVPWQEPHEVKKAKNYTYVRGNGGWKALTLDDTHSAIESECEN